MDEFGTLSGSGQIKLVDLDEQTILLIVGGCHAAWMTRQYGARPCIRATIVVLTGPDAGTIHYDVLLFNQRFVSDLRGKKESFFVAKVAVDRSRAIPVPRPTDAGDEGRDLVKAWQETQPDGTLQTLLAEIKDLYADGERRVIDNAGFEPTRRLGQPSSLGTRSPDGLGPRPPVASADTFGATRNAILAHRGVDTHDPSVPF